jgi:hypothetical protein
MIIIGCDFHLRFQQIAMLDTETASHASNRPHGRSDIRKRSPLLSIAWRVRSHDPGASACAPFLLRSQSKSHWPL